MPELDPNALPGMPAPFWFVELFKGIGFFLHLIPMNLWFAGLPLAILSLLFGGPLANRYARRMFGQLPIFLALGVNFAIVPLLFLQTTYYKSFYTATILAAWYWLLVIPLFLIAYYKIYACSFTVKKLAHDFPDANADDAKNTKKERGNVKQPQKNEPEPVVVTETKPGFRAKFPTVALGFFAWIFLTGIGILLTHGLMLMERSELWLDLWKEHSVAGAATGLGQIFHRPELWLRLTTMFGLALVTSGFWAVIDSHLLIRKTDDEEANAKNEAYKLWTLSFGARSVWLGVLVVFPAFFYYLWFLEQESGMSVMHSVWGTLAIAFVIGCAAQGSILAQAGRRKKAGTRTLISSILVHTLTLGSFVALRQWIQNEHVGRFVRVDLIPENVQWDPLIVFLITFVLGLLVIAWIVRQIAKA